MFSFLTDLFKPKPPVPAPITSETSMAFERDDVGPFFTGLANNPRFGLPAALSDVLSAEVAALGPDASKRWKIDGDFDGAPIQIEVEAAMDDGAPELHFFSSKPVIDALDEELVAFSDAMGP